nr:hypothetical protein [Tanacetum cinerariifolium]
EKPADVIEKSTVVNEKEKPTVDVTSEVAKDKEKSAVDVTSKVGKSKAKDKPSVVKRKVPTELPKKKNKADIPKDKPKPKDKHKIKAEVKRKRKGGSNFDSDYVDEEKLRQVLKKLKKIKTEYSDEESVLKSNKKGFSSFHNVSIDKIPSRLGRYALSKFSSTTYRMTFETGDYVKVTPSKIHDILGDIASKVISAQQVNFLFKVNFLTLFTNTMGRVAGLKGQIYLDVVRRLREESIVSEIDWCGYIHSFLEDSELPKKPTLHYLGPFTFLILLYLGSTKFDRFLVVRTRPAIRDWTSTLMRKRHDLETKEHVIGCLDLHNEWTESELQETEGFTRISLLKTSEREALFRKAEEKLASICSERVDLEDLMRKASSDYPGDRKFIELQEKYVQVFRDPISFYVDVNSVDGGNGSDGDDDGDDDNDDGNGNNDEELNDDNNDGNGNNDEELNDKDTLGSNLGFGFSKIGLDDFKKQPSQEGTNAEKESGDLFGDNSVRMEVSNQGPPTLDRMPGRASNASASLGKRIMKPSSYLLSPYMNKKTKVVPKITRLEFSIGNSLFAMQGDKMLSLKEMKVVWLSKALTWHGTVGRLKHRIPKLKWRTSGNFHDCRVFTMLHMESFNDETAAKWDCGLFVKSGLQCDMLRRLRFKFSTKILLHEINVHSKKMIELANEFDKVDYVERMAIIVEAVKNREERDCI